MSPFSTSRSSVSLFRMTSDGLFTDGGLYVVEVFLRRMKDNEIDHLTDAHFTAKSRHAAVAVEFIVA